MLRCINKQHWNTEKIKHSFLRAKPFPHVVLKNFLVTKTARQLHKDLKMKDFLEKNTDLFQFMQTTAAQNMNGAIKDFFDAWSSQEILDYISTLVGEHVSRADMSGFCYRPGDYLLPHDDLLEGRKVAYVLNLSRNFTQKDGGALEFFHTKAGSPVKVVKKIIPTWNTLTLFQVCDTSFHQVEEILSNKKRYSLAGWFHG